MSLAFRPGDVLANDFVIEQLLSEGGMGRVFIARQHSTGKRRALKVMLPELVQDARLRERFAREAQVGARIESDHIVEVIGAGVDAATGVPWLAMELLDGKSLAQLCAEATFAQGLHERPDLMRSMAGELLRQLCHGLAAAHRAGVVHRDLKPDNVFLARPRRVGVSYTVKILDFGISMITAEARTKATATIGTPFWMAPEQTQHGAAVTSATDVWALGLIAFQLMTAKQYWLSAHSQHPTPFQVLRELALDPLEPASERARRVGYKASLPFGFDAWFARCVNREVGLRFSDAHQAYAALAPILRPPPPPAPRPAMHATVAAGPIDGWQAAAAKRALLNEEKTLASIDGMTDERAKALQRYALMILLEKMDRGELPEATFDLFYFTQVVKELFADHATIDVLLRGDVSTLDWLPE